MKGWKYEIINNFAVSEERKKRCFTHEKWWSEERTKAPIFKIEWRV